MNRKRVLIIGPFPLPISGVSLANQVVAKELMKSPKVEVRIINTSFSSFDERIGAFSFKKLWFYLKLQVYCLKVFNSDIIYITPGQTFFGVVKYASYILVAVLSNKTIIQHLHGNYLGKQYQLLSGIKKKIFYYLMSRTHKGIVLSESLRPNFNPFIAASNIYVLKNFVVDELFIDNDMESKNFKDLRVVYLSNLMEEKGIFDLLDALVALEQLKTPYKARIAGNIAPENRKRAQNYFDKLEHTTYMGTVDVEQKAKLFKWSNTFVLPTYYAMEGQPISILEAMATGNAILTTHHAGIPDVFENAVNGYYVEKQNPLTIVERLEYIANHKEELQSIALHNAQVARENYRVDQFAKNLKKIIF